MTLVYIFRVLKSSWNDSFFYIDKLSPLQLQTQMVDGTFEEAYPRLLCFATDETFTWLENMSNLLFEALAPFMKGGPLHRYTPGTQFSFLPSIKKYMYAFTVWDDYQRECL